MPLPTPSRIYSGDVRLLGRSLRTWRRVQRIKQTHAAALLAVSQATVSRWEAGRTAPSADEAERLRRLMAATLRGGADHALAHLVRHATVPMHLVCDLTHRLLAASSARERQFGIPTGQLLGTSLWPYATEAIVEAEAGLAARGWFDALPPIVEFATGPGTSRDVVIRPGRVRWVRFQLANGSFVRLVESLRADAFDPDQGIASASRSSQSAIAASESHR